MNRLWKNTSLWSLGYLIIALIISTYKISLLETSSRYLFDCSYCLSVKGFIHEIQFLFILIWLNYLSRFIKWLWLKAVVRIIVVGLLVISFVDLIVLNNFTTRFTFQEFITFKFELKAIWDFVIHALGSVQLVILSSVLAAFMCVVFFWYIFDEKEKKASSLSFFLVALGIIFLEWIKPVEYHDRYLKNSIEAFFEQETRYTEYSDSFKKSFKSSPLEKKCYAGRGARPNIILLIVESLSVYHSNVYSGIYDWMPEFDKHSLNGKRLANFHANGVRTEQGLIAFLTGEQPIAKSEGKNKTLLEKFSPAYGSLPEFLNNHDYYTAFMTSADLGFLDMGRWLKSMGFKFIEGNESSYYQGKKRFVFGAVSDEVLYDRVREEIQRLQGEGVHYFITVETVSTHHPFTDPSTGKNSQELTFRYADKQINRFIEQLESMNFFNEGYLLISSDHRAMVPLTKLESDKNGDLSYSKIPFSIIGKDVVQEEDFGLYSQSDLLPSLRHWIGSDMECIDKYQGIFLPGGIQAADCIVTHRSYAANNLYTHCSQGDYVIKLNGDNTNYINNSEGPIDLLNEINRKRIN